MIDDYFDWDDIKAAGNDAKHGVSFEAARAIFKDPFAIENISKTDTTTAKSAGSYLAWHTTGFCRSPIR